MTSSPSLGSLSGLLRSRSEDVLRDWEQAARRLMPGTADVDRQTLLDNFPELLQEIACIADELAAGREATVAKETAEMHADNRIGLGYDLAQVTAEYGLLRDAILRLLAAERPAGDWEGVRVVNTAIDRAVAGSVDHYARARARALHALDRVSSAALESRSVGDLLERLLRVFVSTTPPADNAAILLLEGDHLVMRASVGLGREDDELCLRVGEGFAGRVAAARRGISLRSAWTDPGVVSAAIRGKRVRALYGLPMLDGDQLIGVARMGSCSVDDFSEQDRLLFGMLVSRATAGIAQQLLRDRLDQEHAMLRAVVDQMPVGVVLAAVPSGELVLANEQVSAIFRTPPFGEEVGATPEWHGFHPDGRPLRAEEWPLARAIIHGERVEDRPIDILRGDGTRGTILVRAAPIRDASGRVIAAVAAFMDISRLQDAIRSREEILSIVAHDLRNPLGVVALGADALARSAPPGDQGAALRKRAETLKRSVQAMTRLLGDLLDFESMQAGGLSVAPRPEDPGTIVREIVGELDPAARQKGVSLTAVVAEALPQVSCDRDRVKQVFSNLLANALQVTPAGGAVTVSAAALPGEVRFAVKDTGPGIAPDDLPRVFERRWRGRNAGYPGRGLGLAIAEGLVRAHGGRIDVDSTAGVGTTFCFTIPVAGERAASPPASAA